MDYQLRIYTIQEGRLDEFVEEWRTAIAPLRRRLGFEVAGAWTVPEASHFVWILRAEDFAERDEAYYSSPERAALDPDPARLIVSAEHVMMQPVPES